MSSRSNFSSKYSKPEHSHRPGYKSRNLNSQSHRRDKSNSQEISYRGRSRFTQSGKYKKTYSSDKGVSSRRLVTDARSFIRGRGSYRRHDFNERDLEFDQYYRSRGGERGSSKSITRSIRRSPRSTYSQDRELSLRRSSSYERKVIENDYDDEESLVLSDIDDIQLKINLDSLDDIDDLELFNDPELNFERKMSPLIIHRHFDDDPMKSVSREGSVKSRPNSPIFSRSESFERTDNYSEVRTQIVSRKCLPRLQSRERENRCKVYNEKKRSATRSLGSPSKSRNHESQIEEKRIRTKRDRYIESSSLSEIRKQIELEKEKFKFLEQQNKKFKKRSEASVERLLDDCKKSVEANSKPSSSISLSADPQIIGSTGVNMEELENSKNEKTNNIEQLKDSLEINTINSPGNYIENKQDLTEFSQNEILDTKKLSPGKKGSLGRQSLSPISLTGSFEKTEFSQEICHGLSPISQNENFEYVSDEHTAALSPISQTSMPENKDIPHISIENTLQLSPISQEDNFEKPDLSRQLDLSPVSEGGSFGKDCDLILTSVDNERPKSTDSLQKFLEEFRYCDQSNSSSSLESFVDKEDQIHATKNNEQTVVTDTPISRFNKTNYSNVGDDRCSHWEKKFNDLTTSDEQRTKTTYYLKDTKIDTFPDKIEMTDQFTKRHLDQRSEPLGNVSYLANSKSKASEMIKKGGFEENMGMKSQSTYRFSGHSQQALTTPSNDNSGHDYKTNKEMPHQYQPMGEKPPIQQITSGPVSFQPQTQVNTYNKCLTNQYKNQPNKEVNQRDHFNSQYSQISQNLNAPQSQQNMPPMFRNPSSHPNIYNIGQNHAPDNSFYNSNNTANRQPEHAFRIQNHHPQSLRSDAYDSVPLLNQSQRNFSNEHQFKSKFNVMSNHCFPLNASNIGPKNVGWPPCKQGQVAQTTQSARNVNQFQPNVSSLQYGSTNYPAPTPFHTQAAQSISSGHISNQAITSVPQFPQVVGCAHQQPITPTSHKPITNPGTSGQPPFSSYKVPHGTSNSDILPTFPNYRQFQGTLTNLNQGLSLGTSPSINQRNIIPINYKQPFQQTEMSTNIAREKNYNQFQPNNSSLQSHQYGSTNYSGTASFHGGSNTFPGYQDPSIVQSENPANCLQVQLTNDTFTINREAVNLKRYLNGTFMPGYKIPLGLSVTSEQRQFHVQQCVPKPEFLVRFKDVPPSHEELGAMLNKFVIFFGAKQNSELERDPFNVIYDSFSMSDRFGKLSVEDSEMPFAFSDPQTKHTCVLRWKGIMVARAHGPNQAEARKKASLSLINALAHSCYTVQAKFSYYFGGKLPKFMLNTPEDPGIYKMVGRQELAAAVTDVLKQLKEKGLDHKYSGYKRVDSTHVNVVINLINDFFLANEENYSELIFGGKEGMDYTVREMQIISDYVDKSQCLVWRRISGFGYGKYIAVARKVCPQHLFTFLQSPNDSNVRYTLLPPQGPGIDLLMPDCNYNQNIMKIVMNIEGPINTVPTLVPDRGYLNNRPFYEGKGGGNQGNMYSFSYCK